MTIPLITYMSLFALAASLSPGPVNLVSLSSSARYGWRSGLSFVSGATIGFILLFLMIGFGLHYVLDLLPSITKVLQWFGIAFLLYISYQLFMDNGELNADGNSKSPTFMTGAIMQWLNPKAWLASVSGIMTYIPTTQTDHLMVFASLYFLICWCSLAVWVWAGILLGQYFNSPKKMRLLNKTLAGLLAATCVLILV